MHAQRNGDIKSYFF
ncbi:hypothetical protein [Shewanella woodyi]